MIACSSEVYSIAVRAEHLVGREQRVNSVINQIEHGKLVPLMRVTGTGKTRHPPRRRLPTLQG
jgi:hypothetical protein